MRWFWLTMLALAALGVYGAWLDAWPGADESTLDSPAVGEIPPLRVSFPPTSGHVVESVTRVDDRTVRVADRFDLVGNGTERDPYHISWEYLQSAQDGWKASAGKDALAKHILLMDGSWISIDGYWAPGIVVDETKEVIVLLNRWDGCCLGIPPTPFDCIEAKLTEPVRIDKQHSFRYGTVTGRLEVSPFAFGDVILGLYRFHDARISSQ
ncbi:MAG: hypothetical protein O2819_00520 [Planctomycetota bacterium]|nr:hypothetical protein [Planctomycetota bacterium]MDA1105431.1 hypothetical protein [Planctomycetota bacterium]